MRLYAVITDWAFPSRKQRSNTGRKYSRRVASSTLEEEELRLYSVLLAAKCLGVEIALR